MPREDHFQDISVTGNISVGAQSTIEGSLTPDTDDNRDLGSALKRWANLYLSSTLNATGFRTDSITLDTTNADVVLSRASANKLQLASGDSFQLDQISAVGNINNILFVDGVKYTTIAAAVTAATAGQTVETPPLYTESPSSTITLNKALHLKLGAGTTITSSATNAIEITADNVTISGAGITSKLTFNATGTTGTPKKLIKLTAANDVQIRGLYLLGLTTVANSGGVLTDTGIELDTNSDARIEGNVIEKLNIGVNGVGSDDTQVINNVFRNIVGSTTDSTGYGVLISNGGLKNKVSGNTFLGRNYPTNSSNVMRHAVYFSSATSYSDATGNYAEYTLLAAYTTNSTAAQGQQIGNKFIGNTAYLCSQADVTTEASLTIYGFNRETVVTGNLIDQGKGAGIQVVGLSGDATNKNERNLISDNIITSNNYNGISLEGVFENQIVGNYIYDNGKKTANTYSGIRLSQTPQGGSAVTGSPVNNRMKANYIWGSQHRYAVDDQADHSAIANELTGNTLLTGATGIVNDANSALQMFSNNTNAAVGGGYEQQNFKPRFISGNNLGIALRNGLANGDYLVGVTAAAAPDLQLSNNAGTLRATLTDAGDWTTRRYKSNGTTLVAGDFALSAGWGAGAAVSAVTGTDQGWNITVTAAGVPAANPTIALTFKDGTWTSSPLGISKMVGGTGTVTDTSDSLSATVWTITFIGTPVAASTYIFTGIVMGR